MEVYRGDIYYIEDNYETEGSEQRPGRPVLVVSNDTGNHFSSIVSIVYLTTAEKKPLPTHCEVVAKIPSTALCEQVKTISQNRLGEYIRTATEAEMKEVDKCLMIALGLNYEQPKGQVVATAGMIDDLKMKLEGAERQLDERQVLLDEARKQITEAHVYIDQLQEDKAALQDRIDSGIEPDLIRLETERNLYQALYEKTVERMIAG